MSQTFQINYYAVQNRNGANKKEVYETRRISRLFLLLFSFYSNDHYKCGNHNCPQILNEWKKTGQEKEKRNLARMLNTIPTFQAFKYFSSYKITQDGQHTVKINQSINDLKILFLEEHYTNETVIIRHYLSNSPAFKPCWIWRYCLPKLSIRASLHSQTLRRTMLLSQILWRPMLPSQTNKRMAMLPSQTLKRITMLHS